MRDALRHQSAAMDDPITCLDLGFGVYEWTCIAKGVRVRDAQRRIWLLGPG